MSKTLLLAHHTPSPVTRELLVIETPRLTDRSTESRILRLQPA